MTLEDLNENRIMEFYRLADFEFEEDWKGRPVLRLDRGYAEYGVIIGRKANNLYRVHFGNNYDSKLINAYDLYVPFPKSSISAS